ncbi:MAG: cation:proton antiporter domain-containing protein, partial [Tepidisphaeraceae bacterium]
MALVTVYAVTLMVAVLVSDLTRRSVLSTSVLFLFVGLVLAAGRFTELAPSHVFVQHVAEVALVSTLFTDAMRMPLSELRSVWHLPGRALFVGLPLTLLLTALLTKMLTDLPWLQSLLVGAVLSPTDPVLAAAIVGSRRVPGRVKQLLNVESGLNDGLALPCVMLLLDRLQSHETSSYAIASQLAGGVLLGVVLT